MRVLTPSGRFESRPTPTVAAEQKAIKAVQDAVAEYGPLRKSFLTGNAALAGGGMTAAAQPTSWNNTGNATLNALQARISQNLNASFQKVSPELEGQLAQQGLSWGPPFPPGRPLNPFWGIRGPARTWDFAVGENVQLTPRWNRVSFQTLKALYDKYDVAQICVRHLIDDVRSLEVNWLPPKNCKDDVDADIQKAEAFWAYPDRRQPFDCWLAEWLQDVLRYDAGALFLRETEAGDPYAVEIISGETIIPLIDYFGRRPADEEADSVEDGEIEGHVVPAFLQIIEGMPWDWLTSDQMIYQPLWPLPESQYGQCPLESILLSANTDLRFQWHFLQYFTEGTLTAGFMEAPPDLSDPAQIQAWQEHWDGLMLGDQAKLNQIRWVPAGAKFTDAKPGASTFDASFPLYLMRRTAAAYKVTPADLGFTEEVNKASSEIQVDVQARVGRGPLIQYIEGVVNLITTQRLGLRARMQIDPGGEIEDRVAVAQAHSIYIEKGVESADEVRAELGKPIDKSRPFTRFIDNARSGPIPLLAIESQAGEVDAETYGRAEGQELVSTPYSSPPGALPPMGSPEQKAAGEHTAQAARDLVAATTGQPPLDAVAESGAGAGSSPPGAAPADASAAVSRETPDEQAVAKAIAAVEPLGWRAVLAVIDSFEKGEVTAGITAATGIQGVDLKGTDDDDEDYETASKAAAVAVEMRRWRENARNRLKKGRPMRPFASTVLSKAEHDAVWLKLQKASSREEVDAAFAAVGKPSAGERPASEPRLDERAQRYANAEPHEEATQGHAVKDRSGFHSQADRIVAHYAPLVRACLQGLFTRQQLEDAVRAAQEAKAEPTPAEKAACWDKSEAECSLRELAYREALGATRYGVDCPGGPSEDRAKSSPAGAALKDAPLDLAYLAARKALEAGSANTSDLATALEALYGDSFLQGAYDAALASGSTVVASLRDVAATPPASYWNEWKPGYGQAAAQAADGGMRDLLEQADITLKGMTDSVTDRIGNAIAQGLSEGQSVPRVAQLAADAGASPERAEMIANTEMNRASTAANVATYEEAGIARVEWLAEADACDECEANAEGSPYALDGAPTPPEHPNCRCALAPVVEGPAADGGES